MSQESVYNFLLVNAPKKYSALDISKHLGLGKGAITISLNKLFRWNDIKKQEIQYQPWRYKTFYWIDKN